MLIQKVTYLTSLTIPTMNKEFKTILILGIISILISWIWLYQFRNVKFKNTKELEKRNQEQQQALIDQYNDLVDIYIPNITDKLPENDLPTTWEISLIIPWFFENKWLYTLWDKLKDENILLSIKKIDSYQNFQTEIKNNLQNYDIALVPTNWINGLDTQNISLWENIKPYFITIFSDLIDGNSNNYIPYSIDPAITLYQDISPQGNREKLFSYSLLWKISKKNAMPIIWWFDTLSIKLIENDNTPFENFMELLVLQIKQIKSNWDNQELSRMIDANNISSSNNYTYTNLKKIVDLLTKQNEYCKIYPANCTMRYWYSDIKFWFLSDFDILEKYFPWKTTLYAWNFTNSKKSYPVKWRIFITPNWNNKINLTNKFFSEYISESIEWNDTFRNHTLSAITNIYDKQKNDKFFENIVSNEKNFYLFINSINLQTDIINDWKTIPMLEWKYSTNSYLSNFPY